MEGIVKMADLDSIIKKLTVDDNVVVVEDEDVKAIQVKLLDTLKDIITVCEENHIRYQLGGGSCLGAVRHHGIIPWDDDIDINITRRELKRFIPKFRERFGWKYWIHVPGHTKSYDAMMTHIIRKDVRARVLMDADKVECGLSVDIFTVENTFNNVALRKLHIFGMLGFRYVLSCLRFRRNEDESRLIFRDNKDFEKIARNRLRFARIFSVIPLDTWTVLMDKWYGLCRNNKSKYVCIVSGSKKNREVYVRKDFLKSIRVDFDGQKARITADYDNYLRFLYGNYMEFPKVREKHVMLELDREALYDHSTNED